MKVKILEKESRPEQVVEMSAIRAKEWIKSGEAEKVNESRTTKTQDNDSKSR